MLRSLVAWGLGASEDERMRCGASVACLTSQPGISSTVSRISGTFAIRAMLGGRVRLGLKLQLAIGLELA